MFYPHLSPLVGNEPAKSALQQAAKDPLKAGQVFLLSGPARVGKRSFALAFIQEKFGKIHEWKIQEKLHPDVKWLKPEGKSQLHLVASIQEMQQDAFLSPLEAPIKIYVIEAADRMLPASSNALLKILEEPPSKVIFLLLTEQEESILPTIISRTLKIAFYPIEQAVLEKALRAEGIVDRK